MKFSEGGAARLDRFYTPYSTRNKVCSAAITPDPLLDHKKIAADYPLCGVIKPPFGILMQNSYQAK